MLVYLSPDGLSIPVELEETFEVGGHKLANVRALVGRPFVGGDKWPVRTEFATVPADRLMVVQPATVGELQPAII